MNEFLKVELLGPIVRIENNSNDFDIYIYRFAKKPKSAPRLISVLNPNTFMIFDGNMALDNLTFRCVQVGNLAEALPL